MLVLGVICAVGVDSRDPMVSCLTVRSFMKRLQSGNSHWFFFTFICFKLFRGSERGFFVNRECLFLIAVNRERTKLFPVIRERKYSRDS